MTVKEFYEMLPTFSFNILHYIPTTLVIFSYRRILSYPLKHTCARQEKKTDTDDLWQHQWWLM